MQHKFTPLAIVLALILLLPGLFIGRQVSRLYSFFLSFILSTESVFDFLDMGWVDAIILRIFPNILHGFVAGALAVGITSLILRKSNYEIVFYSIASLMIVLATLSTSVLYIDRGFRIDMIDLISLTIGIVVGVFLLARNRPDSEGHPPL